ARAELLAVLAGGGTPESASGSLHLRSVHVRAENALTGLVHRAREGLVLGERALRGVARLHEGVDRALLVRDDRPAVELLVDELVRGVFGIALPHGALERALVLRLHQGHGLVGMREIEHHHVQLWTERGLEVL